MGSLGWLRRIADNTRGLEIGKVQLSSDDNRFRDVVFVECLRLGFADRTA